MSRSFPRASSRQREVDRPAAERPRSPRHRNRHRADQLRPCSGHPGAGRVVRMYQMIRPRIAIPLCTRGAPSGRPCRPRSAVPGAGGAGDRERRSEYGSTAAAAGSVEKGPVGPHRERRQEPPADRRTVLQQRRRVRQRRAASSPTPRRRSPGPARGAAAGQPHRPRRSKCRAGGGAVRGIGRRDGGPAGALRNDDNALREAARRVLRRALNERFGKRPLIEVQIGAAVRPQHPLRQGCFETGLSLRMIGRLNHVAIVVPDLAAAAARYQGALGGRGLGAACPAGARRHRGVCSSCPTADRALGAARRRLPGARLSRQEPIRRHAPFCAARSTTSSSRATSCANAAPACWAMASRKSGAHGKPVLFLSPRNFLRHLDRTGRDVTQGA